MLAHTDMLRVSCEQTNTPLDLGVVASGDAPPIPFGAELAALVDTMTTRPNRHPSAERSALAAVAGGPATERAIAVCATFNLMNRLLDGVGAPTPANARPMAVHLGFSIEDLPR
jgi:hypothetical protein